MDGSEIDRDRATEFLTIGDGARRSGIGRRQLRRAIASGELPVYDVGWPRLRWSELLEWVAAQRRSAAEGDGDAVP